MARKQGKDTPVTKSRSGRHPRGSRKGSWKRTVERAEVQEAHHQNLQQQLQLQQEHFLAVEQAKSQLELTLLEQSRLLTDLVRDKAALVEEHHKLQTTLAEVKVGLEEVVLEKEQLKKNLNKKDSDLQEQERTLAWERKWRMHWEGIARTAPMQ